jgi:hypothetical protein
MIRIMMICLLLGHLAAAQDSDLSISPDDNQSIYTSDQNPLKPAKAAFYSAILPGLGQAYNKSYWKIPLVYAALGTTLFFYIDNTNQYNTYRDALKKRFAGEEDQFQGVLTTDNLINAQDQFRRNRDLSLLTVIGAYVLNIVDANVDAHLKQFNINEDLSISPDAQPNRFHGGIDYTFTLKFNLD